MSALIGDKGYDGDGFRAEIVNRGAKPVIPNKSNRVTLHSFSKRAYKGRNVIERCFCRLESFRFCLNRGFPNQLGSYSSLLLEAEASMDGASILTGSA